MRHLVFAAALAASALVNAQNSSAPKVDPLWSKTVAQTLTLKKWIAADIDLDIEARNGKEATKGKIRSHLTGWEKGKPVYTVTEIEPAGESGRSKPDTFDVDSFAALSQGIVTEGAPVRRSDQQALHGKQWTMFTVSDTKMGASFNVRMWVDPHSGILDRMETTMQMPLMANMHITTDYAPHAEMGVAPTGSDIDVEVRVPFKSGKMHMVSKPSNWVKRPL